MLIQKKTPISATDTLGSVYFDRLFPMGVEAMLEAIDLVKAGKAPRIKQDEAKATYEGRCGPDNAHIDWGRPWQEIDRLIRGCNPAPGAWSKLDGKTVKIFDAKPLPAKDPKGIAGKMGEIVAIDSDGFCRRLCRRPFQGHTRPGGRSENRGERIRHQRKAHPRNEVFMNPPPRLRPRLRAAASQHANPKSDIEISQAAKKRPIIDIARENWASRRKTSSRTATTRPRCRWTSSNRSRASRTASSFSSPPSTPTPAGEGKTTTTVGLTDALNHIGKKAMLCVREPSLGPSFGMKGGAAGGGYAQVVPMEDINLHFTGDFHAITSANNLLAAMLDNHIYWGNALGIDERRVAWRRVLDMNDRALRSIVYSLGGVANGFPREDGFDITVASEVMAIFCLARDLDDLKKRLGNIVVAYTRDRKPVRASDLKAHGAMTVLLKEALSPNLVQTLEGTPAFIHGGPFANIAHGCNSVLATTTALKLADYVVTEAGFGADLGGEKFLDIKCRKTGLSPDCAVLVATIRALKMHGGVKKEDLKTENLKALEAGMSQSPAPRREHAEIRHRAGDLDQPLLRRYRRRDQAGRGEVQGARRRSLDGRSLGGRRHGAADVARAVVKIAESGKSKLKLLYPDDMPLLEKIRTIAKEIYRGQGHLRRQIGARPAREFRGDGLR